MAHIPLRLKIDATALAANWSTLARLSGSASCGAAVKADGYGLGARDVVRTLATAGCRDFFVATWAEAEALMPWDEGLTLRILHGVGVDDLEQARSFSARPVLISTEQLALWRAAAPGRPCDLMVDTGMNRLGIDFGEMRAELLDGIEVDTLLSHLACADEPDHAMNASQLHRFMQIRREIPARAYSLANSAGIFLDRDYAFDLTRPGLALYGGIPVAGDVAQQAVIRQVVSVHAQLVQVRPIEAGASVGYGATFVAPAPATIGIVNIGYADGFLQLLGRNGRVRFGDCVCPVVGRISMDLLAVDLTPAGSGESVPSAGDWLEIDYRLPELASSSGLSQYELLTGLGSRFARLWS